MVEDPEPTEISSIEQINQEILQEFLAKTSVWDFYEIAKGEYTNKSNDEKKSLIIQYFNYMTSGFFFLFAVWNLFIIFNVCNLDSIFINDKIFSSEFIAWQFLFNIIEFIVW